MRRINALVTAAVMALFMLHLVWGALILTGMTKGGSRILSFCSWFLIILICVHAVISMKMTWDTFAAMKRSGVSYWKENRLFWTRRISGFAVMLFIAVHVLLFRTDMSGGAPRLHLFDVPALVSSVLMVISLFVHLLTNITPLRIALGLRDKGNVRTDVLFVLAIGLLLAGAAFVSYFLRWLAI